MAPTAAEFFEQATDKRARFADGKHGVSKQKENQGIWPALPQKLMAPLSAQVARNEDIKILGLWMICPFFHFSFDQQPHMAHGCQDACCKEGYRKGTYVCGVSSPLFSFAITHVHCCQDQQNERIGGLKIERKNGPSERQNVKTSNDRFFPS